MIVKYAQLYQAFKHIAQTDLPPTPVVVKNNRVCLLHDGLYLENDLNVYDIKLPNFCVSSDTLPTLLSLAVTAGDKFDGKLEIMPKAVRIVFPPFSMALPKVPEPKSMAEISLKPTLTNSVSAKTDVALIAQALQRVNSSFSFVNLAITQEDQLEIGLSTPKMDCRMNVDVSDNSFPSTWAVNYRWSALMQMTQAFYKIPGKITLSATPETPCPLMITSDNKALKAVLTSLVDVPIL